MIALSNIYEIKDQFLTHLKQTKRISEHTLRAYNADIMQLAQLWKTNETTGSLHTIDTIVPLFMNILEQTGRDKSSIARKMSCFNSFKKFLIGQSIPVTYNLKRPYVKPLQPEILTQEELIQLLDETRPHELPTKQPYRDKAIIELLFATGIQCAELVHMELSAINFSENTIIIRNKRKKERIVLFGTTAAKLLIEYMEQERPAAKSPHERVFLNFRGTPLTTRSIQRICAMFRDCFDTKKLITPYILRNSFAHHMLKNGADIETVQELLGHKTKISTQRFIQPTTS